MGQFKNLLILIPLFAALMLNDQSSAENNNSEGKRAKMPITLLSYGASGFNQYSLFFEKVNGFDTITVFKGKGKKNKKIFTYQAELLSHHYADSGFIKFKKNKVHYLVTKWKLGAHGEEIMVFDLTHAKIEKSSEDFLTNKTLPVFFYISSWGIKYSLNNEELVVTGRGEINIDTGIPIKQVKRWSPGGVRKTAKTESAVEFDDPQNDVRDDMEYLAPGKNEKINLDDL